MDSPLESWMEFIEKRQNLVRGVWILSSWVAVARALGAHTLLTADRLLEGSKLCYNEGVWSHFQRENLTETN